MAASVLIVDTEPGVREFLARAFQARGYQVTTATDSEQALAALAKGGVEAAIIELFLRGDHGREFLRRARRAYPDVEFLATGLGLPDSVAVGLLEEGQFAYLPKPLDAELTIAVTAGALEQRRLRLRNQALESALGLRRAQVPCPEPDQAWFEEFRLAAPARLPAIIYGEPGLEKTELARALHLLGGREGELFLDLDLERCWPTIGGAEGIFKSFFSGLAEGSLALRGIDRLEQVAQEELLAAFGDGEDGGPRLVSIFDEHPAQAVAAGRLSPSLFERLGAVLLRVPPLRERRPAIPQLARAIMEASGRRARLSEEALSELQKRPWPGNLRELRAILNGLAHSGREVLAPSDLEAPSNAVAAAETQDSSLSLAEVEKRHILRVLKDQGGNKVRSARVLDINVKTLYNKIRAYGLGS